MRRRNAALVCLALLLCAAFASGCNGSSGATNNHSGSTATAAAASTGLYIALGDSLSFGIGASDAGKTSFVALVRTHLGSGFELMNLGVPGATSQDLVARDLDHALSEIEQRKADSDRNNDVRLVTLEIGGNDLLSIYFALVQTGKCPDVETSLQTPACTDALRSALDGFRPNLTTTLDRLQEADPSLRILLLTLYNPFGHLPGIGAIGDLSLEGKPDTTFSDGLNDIIRNTARGRDDVTVVDIYPLFQGRTPELISGDGIHPNDEGYRVMADAVTAALGQ
jgi:lysophospholipase L1-like esterase/predicted small secreted protein